MAFYPNHQDPLSALSEISFADIVRPENRGAAFNELESNFVPLVYMVQEIADVLKTYTEVIPERIKLEAVYYAEEIVTILRLIHEYDLRTDARDSNPQRKHIVAQAENTANIFLTSKLGNSNISFLNLYTVIKSFDAQSSINNQNQLSSVKHITLNLDESLQKVLTAEDSYRDLSSRAEKTIEDLNKKASEKVIEQYAKIFENQSERHKQTSQLWLLAFAITLVIFLKLLPQIDDFLPLPPSDNGTILALEYVRRLLVVSFGIYVLTFFLKQYNVQKHLETLNKHRQNVFNSFELFVDSLNNADATVRHSLMVEVARSISEAGQTGFINVKDEGATNSITEVTKLVKPE